jgi:prepilin-type processing-associated H-X9-DG protein
MVELLAVVAVIGMLAALLLPVLARGRTSGKRTQCLNNHRQIVLAWLGYANDHEDELPWTIDDGFETPDFTNWVSGHLRRPVDAFDTSLLTDPRVSLLAPYLESARVYKCPADPSPLARSVSMNNRLNPIRLNGPPLCLGGWGTNWSTYRRLGEIQRPSGIFVVLDERFDSITEGNFAVDMSNTGNFNGEGTPQPFWWIDTPAGYHDGAGMLSFADGHVEAHRWQEATTLGPVGVTGPRRTSAGDRDIAWLQTRCAEPRN